MKRILFIVPYPVDEAPSQRFRFEQYFEILKDHGFQIKVKSFWSTKGWDSLYSTGKKILKGYYLFEGFIRRCLLMSQIPSSQYIFLHREATPIGPPIFEFLISKLFRKKIIYDFDDAIWLPNTSDQNSMAEKVKFHGKVKQICSWSWKVSCGNAFLADFARIYNNQVYINPTTIDVDYHKPEIREKVNDPITIGWTGSHSTLKYLESIIDVLEELKEKYTFRMIVIADQPPTWGFDDYEFVKWNKEKEIEQLMKIDIGIMPLNDSRWEKGKCGFKAIQYMALGKPAVVSNVGVNKDIVEQGISGFLCRDSEDWVLHLSELISNEKLRISMGKAGREKIKHHYSIQSNADLFLSLFE